VTVAAPEAEISPRALGRTQQQRGLLAAAERFWMDHPALTVSLVALLWALVQTAGLVRHLGDDIFGTDPQDSTGTVAIYNWWAYAVLHGKGLFDYPWGAPIGAGFEHVPYAALQLAVSIPMSVVFGGVVTYNIQVLAGFPLTAWVTFLLARQLGLPALAAAFSALALTFIPYHLEKAMAGHVAMIHMELFSAALLFLVRWRTTGLRRNLVWAGLVAGLALCVDPYDAYIILVMSAAFFVVGVLLPSGAARGVLRRLADHALAAGVVALAAAVLVPVALLALARPTATGSVGQAISASSSQVVRSDYDVLVYSARPLEYVLPWHDNPLVPGSVREYEADNLHLSNVVENTLFVGYTVLALAIVGAIFARRLYAIALSLAVALFGFVFSLPPLPVSVLGIPVSAPSHYLYALLPYFRVYARFGVLVILGAVLLAGLGFAVLMSRLGTGRRRLLLAVPFLLVACEFNELPPTHTSRLYPAPAEYTWLAQQPEGVVIEYPLAVSPPALQEKQTRRYMLYQSTHGKPIFNGSQYGSPADNLRTQLEPYSSPQVVDRLRSLGIRYVLVHRNDYAADGQQLPDQVPGLRFVTNVDGCDVFEVIGA
jgi:hypothetical protein